MPDMLCNMLERFFVHGMAFGPCARAAGDEGKASTMTALASTQANGASKQAAQLSVKHRGGRWLAWSPLSMGKSDRIGPKGDRKKASETV